MKKFLSLLPLAALTIGLLGSCSKIDERISNLEKRVDGIEATSIASVQQQIDGIKTSINDLKAADAAINGKIDDLKTTAEAQQTLIDALKEANKALGQKDEELEARIATLEGQVTTIGGQIEALVEADKAINTRIDELKSYVDTELGKIKDWAEETFATLDQYQQTADDLAALSVTVTGISTTLAGVQTSISGLDTKIDGINTALQGKITAAKTELEGKITSLKTELEGKITTAITASETSIKSWINGLLEGYYTIAEVEEKIGALNTAIDAAKGTAKYRIDSLATELTALKTTVDTVKANIRSEYKTAIDEAINKLDGEIRGALKDSILAVNGRAEALDTRVTTLEGKVLNLEGNVNKLLAMIQSVSITPAYSDGSVEAEDGILTLKCIVRPAEALNGMVSLKDSLLIYADLVKVKTKATPAYMEIKVKEASKLDAAQGAITLKADISEYLPKDADKALTVALKIKNGISDFTTEFVPVYVAPAPVLPDGALAGEFTVNAEGKKVYFSKGNLTYNVTTKNWAFYEHQYDCAAGYDAELISLFTWGYDANKSILPSGKQYLSGHGDDGESFSKSEDWGYVFGGESSVWRTLTKDEWTYLFKTRTVNGGTGEGKSYQRATINSDATGGGIYGMILYPNNYSETSKTSYTSAEWVSLENVGCVFLPAANMRDVSTVSDVGKYGYYWSSTSYSNTAAYDVYFWENTVDPGNSGNRGWGFSVRLVTSGVSPKPVVPVTGVTLNKTELSLKVGKSETLVATVQPADATNKNVIWSSDNTGVATVGSTDGKVTAVAEGTATITAIVDGLFTATCTVTVKALPAGALAGEFTVNADGKQVHFSQGNLVATIDANGTPTDWKFAANQYEYLGEGGANKTIGNTAGDVDLFGWSASNNGGTSTTDNYGIMTSTTGSDYLGDFYDWGKAYCASKSISPDNTWRTLSIDEWTYLFNTRTMANGGARYENLISSSITVEGVIFKGVVLFPDNFTEQATWKDTYTTWEALNNAGLVFLPAAGLREGSNVRQVDSRCYYWSSSTQIPPEEAGPTVVTDSHRWFFHSSGLNQQSAVRYYGHSVRLITE